MSVEWIDLSEIPPAALLALHRDPRVLHHLPLATGIFDAPACRVWLAEKARVWAVHGVGVRALRIDGQFAGWGGLQPEAGDLGLALVLSPRFWGHGPALCRALLDWAFDGLGRESVVVLLPPSRPRTRALARLGFQAEGEVVLDGQCFVRFRCRAPGPARSSATCPGC